MLAWKPTGLSCLLQVPTLDYVTDFRPPASSFLCIQVWCRSGTEHVGNGAARSDVSCRPTGVIPHRTKSQSLGVEHIEEAVWIDSWRTLECATDSRPRRASCKEVTSKGTNANIVDFTLQDVLSWTKRIWQYTKSGQCREALRLYDKMRQGEVRPNSYTFVAVLKACSQLLDLETCKQIHAHVVESGLETHEFVANTLLDVYAKCGSLSNARYVFEKMPYRTVVSWNAMILAYAQMQEGEVALQLYARMQQEGVVPNDRTFIAALKSCSSLVASKAGDEGYLMLVKRQTFEQARAIHSHIVIRGFESGVFVGTMLVDAYAKCGNLVAARHVFENMPQRSVVSWNAMILGYAQMGEGVEALELYAQMRQERLVPNDRTFVGALKACSSLIALAEGSKELAGIAVVNRCVDQVRAIHSDIKKSGSETAVFVGTMLVDVYAKCGILVDARRVFEKMPFRDVVAWNAMITGYAQMEEGEKTLQLYARMQQEGIVPDDCTFVGALKACSSLGALQQGKKIHVQIQEQGLEADLVVGNSLVNLYTKCGSLLDARRVFDGLPSKNVVTWNALLYGYAKHGSGQLAMQCFNEMLHQRVEPDDATFTSILVACSHGALVYEGQQYFKRMVEDCGIAPTVHHYCCMVDLLGRSGLLDEAEDLVQTMPFGDDIAAWTSLLSACKSHGDAERGERCFHRLIALDPQNAVPYVLLANMYANAGRWKDVYRVEGLRKSSGARKKPAKACIEVKYKVHEFTVGEERSDISSKLRNMNMRLRKEGSHIPHTELVLKAVSEQEKEDALCGHAEKLALAYGLLNTPDGETLLVTKNLRMCNDCHSSTKIMSSIERREIIVRDAHRVHRFVDGSCSCADLH